MTRPPPSLVSWTSLYDRRLERRAGTLWLMNDGNDPPFISIAFGDPVGRTATEVTTIHVAAP